MVPFALRRAFACLLFWSTLSQAGAFFVFTKDLSFLVDEDAKDIFVSSINEPMFVMERMSCRYLGLGLDRRFKIDSTTYDLASLKELHQSQEEEKKQYEQLSVDSFPHGAAHEGQKYLALSVHFKKQKISGQQAFQIVTHLQHKKYGLSFIINYSSIEDPEKLIELLIPKERGFAIDCDVFDPISCKYKNTLTVGSELAKKLAQNYEHKTTSVQNKMIFQLFHMCPNLNLRELQPFLDEDTFQFALMLLTLNETLDPACYLQFFLLEHEFAFPHNIKKLNPTAEQVIELAHHCADCTGKSLHFLSKEIGKICPKSEICLSECEPFFDELKAKKWDDEKIEHLKRIGSNKLNVCQTSGILSSFTWDNYPIEALRFLHANGNLSEILSSKEASLSECEPFINELKAMRRDNQKFDHLTQIGSMKLNVSQSSVILKCFTEGNHRRKALKFLNGNGNLSGAPSPNNIEGKYLPIFIAFKQGNCFEEARKILGAHK